MPFSILPVFVKARIMGRGLNNGGLILTTKWGLVLLLFLMWVLMPCQFANSGSDEMGDIPESAEVVKPNPVKGDGVFFAEIEQLHDLHNPNFFEAVVKVSPGDEWPGQTLTDTNYETNQRYWIKIRGIDVPAVNESRNKPHVEMRRHRRRFERAMDFVWKILSASEYMVLGQPELQKETGSYFCDVYVDLGGQRLSLADMMVDKGHALYGQFGEFDWGREVVRRRSSRP